MTEKARPTIRQGAAKRALAAGLAGEKRRQWLAQNDAAIAAYNESVSRLGVFSNGRRRF